MSIPFVRELEFEYGRADEAQPGLRRVIANNPGAFTFYGTGTYIIGEGNVAVVDPGLPMRHTFAPSWKLPVARPSLMCWSRTRTTTTPRLSASARVHRCTYLRLRTARQWQS